jgi:lysophospholipase L1-like esterase
MAKNFIYFFLLLLLPSLLCHAQEPSKFEKEVNDLVSSDSAVNRKNLILFTGSSSIRMWTDLKERYPQYNVLNRGFGGSQMSDLIYFADKLIFQYRPKQIFIYEGDNDLASGMSPDAVLAQAKTLLKMVREKLPKKVKVAFLSAKPSIRRWNLKAAYEDYNAQLKAWALSEKNVTYVDVWSPLIDNAGNVRQDIFLEDNLHLNAVGYHLWSNAIEDHLSLKLKK